MTTRDSWDWDQVAGAIGRVGGIYRDFMAGLDDRRVTPVVDRENLRTRFRGSIQDTGTGIGIEAMLAEIERDVLPNAMTTPHPCYVGLVNSSPLPAAPLADPPPGPDFTEMPLSAP